MLQMTDVFSFNVKGFKLTWRDLVGLLKEDDSDQQFVVRIEEGTLAEDDSDLPCP